MAQGLKSHHHEYFEYNIKSYYDSGRHCMIKRITYMCMICGKLNHEVYECYQPPPQRSHTKKVLQKNKKKYGNH